jgi:hypothetical protein
MGKETFYLKLPTYEELAAAGGRERNVPFSSEGYDFLISSSEVTRNAKVQLPNGEFLTVSLLLSEPFLKLPFMKKARGAYVTAYFYLESSKDGLPSTLVAQISEDTTELKKTELATFIPIIEAALRVIRAFCLTRYHLPTDEDRAQALNVQNEKDAKTKEILDRYR